MVFSRYWIGPVVFGVLSILISACDQTITSRSSDLCSNENLITGDSTVLWQTQTSNGIARPPMVGLSTVVVIDRNWQAVDSLGGPQYSNHGSDTIIAIDIATGTRRWEFSTRQGEEDTWYVRFQSISSHYYAIVAGSDARPDDFLAVFDLATGQQVLNLELDAASTISELALSEEYVFVTLNQAVHAYRLSDGQLAWHDVPGSRVIEDGLFFSPEINLLFVADVQVSALDANTGQQVASLPKGGANFLVTKDLVLSAGTDELGVQFWSGEADRSYYLEYSRALWPPAISDGTIYLLDRQAQLQVISLSSNQVVTWPIGEADIDPVTPPIFQNGMVYFIASDGSLRGINPITGTGQQLLMSSSLRYPGNIPGGFTEHYWPGITTIGGDLIASFGCRTVITVAV